MSSPEQNARESMVRRQLVSRGIRDARVLDAMGRVPRERFIPAPLASEAYADRALGIDCGQTISQPYIVALMSEALGLRGDETVLEIGTGSGYQTAILAELAHDVVSIERHRHLSQQASQVLSKLGYQNIVLIVDDGSRGYPPRAPYSRILAAAAANEVPSPLLDQLADGGILVIPVGGEDYQTLQAIRRHGDQFKITSLSTCRFVPFISDSPR